MKITNHLVAITALSIQQAWGEIVLIADEKGEVALKDIPSDHIDLDLFNGLQEHGIVRVAAPYFMLPPVQGETHVTTDLKDKPLTPFGLNSLLFYYGGDFDGQIGPSAFKSTAISNFFKYTSPENFMHPEVLKWSVLEDYYPLFPVQIKEDHELVSQIIEKTAFPFLNKILAETSAQVLAHHAEAIHNRLSSVRLADLFKSLSVDQVDALYKNHFDKCQEIDLDALKVLMSKPILFNGLSDACIKNIKMDSKELAELVPNIPDRILKAGLVRFDAQVYAQMTPHQIKLLDVERGDDYDDDAGGVPICYGVELTEEHHILNMTPECFGGFLKTIADKEGGHFTISKNLIDELPATFYKRLYSITDLHVVQPEESRNYAFKKAAEVIFKDEQKCARLGLSRQLLEKLFTDNPGFPVSQACFDAASPIIKSYFLKYAKLPVQAFANMSADSFLDIGSSMETFELREMAIKAFFYPQERADDNSWKYLLESLSANVPVERHACRLFAQYGDNGAKVPEEILKILPLLPKECVDAIGLDNLGFWTLENLKYLTEEQRDRLDLGKVFYDHADCRRLDEETLKFLATKTDFCTRLDEPKAILITAKLIPGECLIQIPLETIRALPRTKIDRLKAEAFAYANQEWLENFVKVTYGSFDAMPIRFRAAAGAKLLDRPEAHPAAHFTAHDLSNHDFVKLVPVTSWSFVPAKALAGLTDTSIRYIHPEAFSRFSFESLMTMNAMAFVNISEDQAANVSAAVIKENLDTFLACHNEPLQRRAAAMKG